MKKVLLSAPKHRLIELNSMADRIRDIGEADPVIRVIGDEMGLDDVYDLIEEVIDSDIIVVAEALEKGNARLDPPMILMPRHENLPLIFEQYSMREILKDFHKGFHFITIAALAVADCYKKTVVIIPGRGDESETPTYTPPKCWFDNLTHSGANTWFYS